ncbi:MAG TPA: serine hydrolase [Candidatus Binatia bacterium]|nr:serine hydrolase [Candidatus Binatia bacterium]
MLSRSGLTAMASAAGLREPSVVLRSLDGTQELELDAQRLLYPASMIKTPLAAAALALAAAAKLKLEDAVAVREQNMTANDLPSALVPGYRARIGELIDLMITQSDNVATNVLIDVVERERATALLHELGFPETAIRRKLSGSDPLIDDPGASGRNTHPAREAARLFDELAHERLPLSSILLDALARQRWNTKLSRGLGPGDRFAHKTGDTSEVSHDGGILTTASGRSYVLVVYTGMPSSDEVDACFAAFMRALRPHLE